MEVLTRGINSELGKTRDDLSEYETLCEKHFGNKHKCPLVTGKHLLPIKCYNERRTVMGRCPLLITRIRNGKQRPLPQLGTRNWCFSRPTGDFGNRHQHRARYINSTSETRSMNQHLPCLYKWRRFLYVRLLSLNERRHLMCMCVSFHRLLSLDERRRLLCTRVTSVSTKGDTCCEPASPLSRQKGQVLGPTGQYW
jgi:hypothetical protein